MKLSRRTFLAGLVAASGATLMTPKKTIAAVSDQSYATLIDLTKCDGCAGEAVADCVQACRSANQHRFPEPNPEMLKPYWPQKSFEDWSQKREITNRLTPYNWTFVQRVTVEHGGAEYTIAIPRRCMHCDNPPCAKLCPFGIMKKHPEGMVDIDPDLCFGGAKCRTVCPWNIPQRQAGVGIYQMLDPLPAGGGVMFKCDLCKDKLTAGEQPACIQACSKQAMTIGPRREIMAHAEALRSEYNGFLYGKEEHGGTSTVYVSKVPFEKIDAALLAQAKKTETVMRLHQPDNILITHEGKAKTALLAPVIGAVGAFMATANKEKKGEEK